MKTIYLKGDLDLEGPLQTTYVDLYDWGGHKHHHKALVVPGFGTIPCSKRLENNFTNKAEELAIVMNDDEDKARLNGRVVTDEGEANQEAGESTNETTKKEMTNLKGKKTLVAYFSWSGNTKEAAHYIAQKVGADEFEIIREKAYPTEYNACAEDAKAEKEAGERPAIKGKVENMAQYDVVFVCVPVWWYTAPMPVFTFLEQYDLSGKTVSPLCTAYSGPSSTLRDIERATPKSDHRNGICVVTKEQGGKDMDKKHGKIDKWLTEIGF